MKIGKVAEHVGVVRETIQRWEKEGVIPQASRNIVNWRVYTPEDVLAIQKIIRERHPGKGGSK
jgi:DNA-binding transcriptional MerR regulator